MKKPPITLGIFLILFCSSCVSTKDMVYLQGSKNSSKKFEVIAQNYEIKIQSDDLLSITLNSKDQELLEPFGNTLLFGTSAKASSQSSTTESTYFRVDEGGYIQIPLLGKIHAAGYTREQLTDSIKELIIKKNLMKDPMVTIRLKNFKVSVMGAVNKPGQYTISGERITILEALAQAGDLATGGKRKNLLLLRENNGERQTHTIDLTNINLVKSPYYYLQQNDILYVEPNASIAVQGNPAFTYLSAGGSILSLGVSLATLITVLYK